MRGSRAFATPSGGASTAWIRTPWPAPHCATRASAAGSSASRREARTNPYRNMWWRPCRGFWADFVQFVQKTRFASLFSQVGGSHADRGGNPLHVPPPWYKKKEHRVHLQEGRPHP